MAHLPNNHRHGQVHWRNGQMREWLYVLVPVVLAVYFVLHPAELGQLISQIVSFLR
jgi:hypothetical protein